MNIKIKPVNYLYALTPGKRQAQLDELSPEQLAQQYAWNKQEDRRVMALCPDFNKYEVTITSLRSPHIEHDLSLDYFEYNVWETSEERAKETAKKWHYDKYPCGNGIYESYISA